MTSLKHGCPEQKYAFVTTNYWEKTESVRVRLQSGPSNTVCSLASLPALGCVVRLLLLYPLSLCLSFQLSRIDFAYWHNLCYPTLSHSSCLRDKKANLAIKNDFDFALPFCPFGKRTAYLCSHHHYPLFILQYNLNTPAYNVFWSLNVSPQTLWGFISGRTKNRTQVTSFIQHYLDTYTLS